jgi:hypothetical protein
LRSYPTLFGRYRYRCQVYQCGSRATQHGCGDGHGATAENKAKPCCQGRRYAEADQDSDHARPGLVGDPAPLQPARAFLHEGMAAYRISRSRIGDQREPATSATCLLLSALKVQRSLRKRTPSPAPGCRPGGQTVVWELVAPKNQPSSLKANLIALAGADYAPEERSNSRNERITASRSADKKSPTDAGQIRMGSRSRST